MISIALQHTVVQEGDAMVQLRRVTSMQRLAPDRCWSAQIKAPCNVLGVKYDVKHGVD